jgi:predicted DNA-binding transcriptional regulator YafY
VRTLAPHGLLFERINYLVAAAPSDPKPRTWRLDRISDFELLDEPSGAPEGFSIAQYAARSFGVYFDAIEQVSLRVLPDAAEDAKRWWFHPRQTVEAQPDGSVLVNFQSSGMLELAWHPFTWRGSMEILGPDRLKAMMGEDLRRALARHA